MDLNSLPKILAERLTLDVAELPDRTSPDDWPEAMLITDSELRQMAEAVIREAIEKTLERAREIAQMYRDSKNEYLNAEQCAELIRNRIVDEIHALKQSNSGMEVRK